MSGEVPANTLDNLHLRAKLPETVKADDEEVLSCSYNAIHTCINSTETQSLYVTFKSFKTNETTRIRKENS